MAAAALYYVCAVRLADGERADLLRCDSVADPLDLPPLLTSYAADFAGQDDVLLDVDTRPAA